MDLIQQLNWRYATKRMDTTKVVSDEKINTIIEAIRLSASSFGLQPYHVIKITDKETLQKIQPTAYNQPQIIEASALLVFAVWDTATTERIDEYFNLIASERSMPVEQLDGFKAQVTGVIGQRNEVENFAWMARQAYIGLGTGLVAAALEQVDATPMEGFIPHELDKVLGLEKLALKSIVLMAIGHRDEVNDHLLNAKKVRKPLEKFVVNL